MRKIVLTFGLIAGAVMSATFLIALPFQDQIGFDNGMLVGYTSMVAAFLMVLLRRAPVSRPGGRRHDHLRPRAWRGARDYAGGQPLLRR